jgi:hypothetical protein
MCGAGLTSVNASVNLAGAFNETYLPGQALDLCMDDMPDGGSSAQNKHFRKKMLDDHRLVFDVYSALAQLLEDAIAKDRKRQENIPGTEAAVAWVFQVRLGRGSYGGRQAGHLEWSVARAGRCAYTLPDWPDCL